MTITANDRRKEYSGNGTTTVFTGPRAFSASHVAVYLVTDGEAVETEAYTLTGVGGATTTVTMDTAPDSGTTVLILRTVPYEQAADISNQGAYLPETLETAGLDPLAMQIQQLADGVNRTMRLSDTVVGVTSTTLPAADPLKPLVWNADGTALENGDTTLSGDLLLRDNLASEDAGKGAALVAYRHTGAGAIGRTLQEKLEEVVGFHVNDFGAIPDSDNTGTGESDAGTDNRAAFQAAFDAGVATGKPFVVRMGAGAYKIGGELDLSAATKSYAFIGEGRNRTFLCPTPFGASKALFKGTHASFGGDTSDPQYMHFTVRRGTRDKRHPIIFYYPRTFRLDLRFINTGNIGNSIIFGGVVFNCDWSDFNFFTSGYQPLHKELSSTVRASITSGSPVVTTTEPIFDGGDIGKIFYVQQITNSESSEANSPGNSALVAQIVSVDSSTQVTLSRNSFFTGTGRRLSFDCVRGSMTSGDDVLTLDADCLDADDLGRFLYIDRARSSDEDMLSVEIVEIISANECRVSKTAGATIAFEAVWFAPTIYLGRLAGEMAGDTTTPVNDITITNMLVEIFHGPGVILDGGTHAWIKNPKFHGHAYGEYNNFARSRQAVCAYNMTRTVVDKAELEFGCHGRNSGYIISAGDPSSMLVDQTTLNSAAQGGYTFDFRTNDERSVFLVGNVFGSRDFSKDQGLVNTSGTLGRLRVVGSGYMGSTSRASERLAQLPHISSGFRSTFPAFISPGAAETFTPWRDNGFVLVTSDNGNEVGFFYYRAASSGAMTSVYSGSNMETSTSILTGTTGTSGKVTISAASNGNIYLENRTANGRSYTLTFFC